MVRFLWKKRFIALYLLPASCLRPRLRGVGSAYGYRICVRGTGKGVEAVSDTTVVPDLFFVFRCTGSGGTGL